MMKWDYWFQRGGGALCGGLRGFWPSSRVEDVLQRTPTFGWSVRKMGSAVIKVIPTWDSPSGAVGHAAASARNTFPYRDMAQPVSRARLPRSGGASCSPCRGGQAVFLTFSIQPQQNVVQRTTPLVRLVTRNQLASSQVTRRSRPASISRTSSGAPTSRSTSFPSLLMKRLNGVESTP